MEYHVHTDQIKHEMQLETLIQGGGYFFESSPPKKGCIFKVCAPIRDTRKFGGLAYSREGAYSRKYAVLEMNSVDIFNLPIKQLQKPTVQQSK